MNSFSTVNALAGVRGEPLKSWIQVTHVRLTHPNGGHEHISHLRNSAGMWTRAQVVAWIESGEFGFYTLVNGKRAEVRVRHTSTTKYVQTIADGVWNDNLLALPRG